MPLPNPPAPERSMSKPAFEDIFAFSGRRNRKSDILHMIGMVAPAGAE